MIEMTGKDIVEVLENGLWYGRKPRGRFPQVSGLKLVADTSKRPGQRIVEISVGGQPLEGEKKYKVATNDFLARGSEGFSAFTRGRIIIGKLDGKLVSNHVMALIRRTGTIWPKIEGRITFRKRSQRRFSSAP